MICPLAQLWEEGWVPYQCHMIYRALFWAERARWSGDETIVEAPETREVSRRGLRFVFEVTQTLSLTTLSRPDSYPRWLNGVEDARINTSALCVSGVHATSFFLVYLSKRLQCNQCCEYDTFYDREIRVYNNYFVRLIIKEFKIVSPPEFPKSF